jgi:hypothetical protein
MTPCPFCNILKPIEEYSKAGLGRACDTCVPIRDRRRNQTEAARARKRRWGAEKVDPMKATARRIVRAAIVSGKLMRPDACEVCGDSSKRADGVTGIQAHHDDYDEPLSVRWLCTQCHSAWHRLNDAQRLGRGKDGAS